MHRDMLLLVERLVVAVESMSEDVKNMSAYMYDLNYNVSRIHSEKRELDGVLPSLSDDSVNLPPGVPQPSQKASAGSAYSWPNDPPNESQVLPHDDVEQEEMPVQNVVSITKEVKSEVDSETEGEDVSYHVNTVTNNLLRQENGSSTEMNRFSHFLCSSSSFTSPPASSSSSTTTTQCRQDEAMGMNNQKNISKSTRVSGCGNVLLQCQEHLAVASCSTAYDSKVQEKPEDRYLPEDCGGEQVWKENQLQHTDQGDWSCYGDHEDISPERDPLGSASSERPCERREGGRKISRYECSICKKVFSKKCNLVVHTRVHTGDRPFECSHCRKTFKHSSYLKVHMRSHMGEKPHKCPQCGKCYSQSGHLNVHLRKHAEISLSGHSQ